MNAEHIQDTSDTVVTNYINKQSADVFNELRDIMNGKVKANPTHMKQLCRDINVWIHFLDVNETGDIPNYRVVDGKIETFYPKFENDADEHAAG